MASGGYSLAVVHGLLTMVDSLVWSTGSRVHGLQQSQLTGSAVVSPGLRCFAACGILVLGPEI